MSGYESEPYSYTGYSGSYYSHGAGYSYVNYGRYYKFGSYNGENTYYLREGSYTSYGRYEGNSFYGPFYENITRSNGYSNYLLSAYEGPGSFYKLSDYSNNAGYTNIYRTTDYNSSNYGGPDSSSYSHDTYSYTAKTSLSEYKSLYAQSESSGQFQLDGAQASFYVDYANSSYGYAVDFVSYGSGGIYGEYYTAYYAASGPYGGYSYSYSAYLTSQDGAFTFRY